jgi:cytochrome c biogenesis factor
VVSVFWPGSYSNLDLDMSVLFNRRHLARKLVGSSWIRGGWWFRDPVENASFMPRVLATARIHSVILPLLHSWTLLLNIVTFLCCVLGTFSIRSGLLAPVHSFATDDTRGIFLWRFFLLMTGISMILFSQQANKSQKRDGFVWVK